MRRAVVARMSAKREIREPSPRISLTLMRATALRAGHEAYLSTITLVPTRTRP
jgi:hypothetical protein